MRIHTKTSYYKTSRKGRSPASFHAVQNHGLGQDIHANIKLDPVLKKHKDLRNGILKHEKEEIKHWGNGHLGSHHIARSKEPKITRQLGGVKGFWKEIDRRGKK